MLIELGFVLSVDIVVLSFSGFVLRSSLRGAVPGGETRRLINAATRAAEAFLFRAARLSGVTTVAVVGLVAIAHAVAMRRNPAEHGLAMASWTILAVVVGAASTLVAAYVAVQVSLRAALRGVRACQVSQDQGLTLGIRSAGAVALLSESLGTATVVGLFALLYLLSGGATAIAPGDAVPLLERAEVALPGLALGSIAVAHVLGVAGTTYRVSSEAGVLSTPGLSPRDPRNPSMVVDLVGDHVGRSGRGAADAVAMHLLASTALVLLGVIALRLRGDLAGTRAWALVSMPLVIRSTGKVASLFGVMVARSREGERPLGAVLRGYAVTGLLGAGGVAGAGVWLLGSPAWPWFLGAAALGVAAALTITLVTQSRLDRRRSPVQTVLEGARAGHPIPLLHAVSIGRGAVLWVIASLAVASTGAYQLGQRSQIPGGGVLGLAIALACVATVASFAVAVYLLGPIASGTSSAVQMEDARSDARRRASILDDAAFEGSSGAEAVLVVLTCAAAIVAALMIPVLGGYEIGGSSFFSLARLPVLWAGLLGAASIWAVSSQALSRATQVGRAVLLELDRQLRGFPKENGVPVIPEGYTPSYRALVELTARASTERLLVPALVSFVTPVALGIALRVLYTSAGLATEGLTSFVVIASAVGLGAALTSDGSRAVLGAAYRASRPRGSSPGFEASLSGHAFGSFAFDVTAFSVRLFVITVATVALFLVPLLA